MDIGDAFLYLYPDDECHMFVIIGKASIAKKPRFVCVMVSSWKDGSPNNDPACIIRKGEHPFIQWDSYIAYRETSLFSEEQILLNIKKSYERVSDDLLKRITEGAFTSRRMHMMYLDFIKRV